MKTKTQTSCAVTAQLISDFVFATQIVQSLYSLNQKYEASGHLLWQYSPVCIGPGRKPQRPVFSQRGSLYPRHLCRGVYSFRLSVRPFVCSYVRSFVCSFVRSFVRSFVLPSVAWNLCQSFALKFLKLCISQQLLIRKHSYLDHSYPGGLAFTP